MIVDLADVKQHLNVTTSDDDALLSSKIAAASQWTCSYIGDEFLDDGAATPEPVKEAVRQLVGHLFENREATLVGATASEIPFGVTSLLEPYRRWVF